MQGQPGKWIVYAILLLAGSLIGLASFANAAEPAVVRGLVEASFPFFGAVGLLMSALFLSSAGYATLATGALPRWTGWVAYGAAVANLAVDREGSLVVPQRLLHPRQFGRMMWVE